MNQYPDYIHIGSQVEGFPVKDVRELCPEYPGPHVHVFLGHKQGQPPPRPPQLCIPFRYPESRNTRSIAATYQPREYLGPSPRVEERVESTPIKKRSKRDDESRSSWTARRSS